MNENLYHEDTAASEEIEKQLKLSEEDSTWFSDWLKINFSNMDPYLKDFRTSVIQTF